MVFIGICITIIPKAATVLLEIAHVPIRILVVEKEEIIRRGLEQVLASSDLNLIAICPHWAEALKLISQRRVDVLVVDPIQSMVPIFTDLEQLRWVNPKVRVILYSDLANPAYAAKAFAIGAKGLLAKSTSAESFISAVRSVHKGEHLWTTDDHKRCPASMLANLQFDSGIPLTIREKEVLVQIAEGASNKQIAENLKLSYESVKVNVQQILKKIDVEDRTQAALWGIHHGVIPRSASVQIQVIKEKQPIS